MFCSYIKQYTMTSTPTDKVNKKAKKDKRGPSKMSEITQSRASDGPKIVVEFNQWNQVKSPPCFQSYLGSLVRSHIPITIKDWKTVEDDLKTKCWETVFVSKFNINSPLIRIQQFGSNNHFLLGNF